MRILFTLFLLLPLSYAQAREVTVEVSDVLQYAELTTYADGTVAILHPKVYDYWLGAGMATVAESNSAVVCRFLNMFMLHADSQLISNPITTVNYEDANPEKLYFSGGDNSLVLERVLCKP